MNEKRVAIADGKMTGTGGGTGPDVKAMLAYLDPLLRELTDSHIEGIPGLGEISFFHSSLRIQPIHINNHMFSRCRRDKRGPKPGLHEQ